MRPTVPSCSPLSGLEVCAPKLEVCAPKGAPVKAKAAKYRSVDALIEGKVARASPAATLREISIMLGRSSSRKSFELCESYNVTHGLKYPRVAGCRLDPGESQVG